MAPRACSAFAIAALKFDEPIRGIWGALHAFSSHYHNFFMSLFYDNTYECQDVKLRKEYVKLVDSVRESGGDVKIFSSLHISGEQLQQLTGIAAILRFPMPELEEDEDSEEDQ